MTKDYLTQDSEARKRMPMAAGLLDYFPAALAAVAEHSYHANEKHNPGQELHWSRHNSTDHADCIVRHVIERGGFDGEGRRHSAALAWRALALLQEELEAEGAAPGRGSRFPQAAKSPDEEFLGGAQWSADDMRDVWAETLAINVLPNFAADGRGKFEVTPQGSAALAEHLEPKKRVLTPVRPKPARKRKK